MTTFNEFNLNEDILKAVSLMGFEEATPIQEQAIPVALAGEDLIGLAHTGTGKTAAFGIPSPSACRLITIRFRPWSSPLPVNWPCRWRRN